MNSLSWFLYLAGVAGNLSAAFGITFVVGLIAWGLLNVSVLITSGEILSEWKDFGKWWRRGAVALFIFAVVGSLLPSKNTLYAIAASEMGEKLAKSDEVQGITGDATKALRSWIQSQITESTETKKK